MQWKPCPRSPASQLRSWLCRKPGRATAKSPSKTTGNFQFALIWTSSSQLTPGEGLGKAGCIRTALQPRLPLHGTEQRFGKSKPFPMDVQCCPKSRYGSWVFSCSSHMLKAGGTHRVVPTRVSDLLTQHHLTPSSGAPAIPYHKPKSPTKLCKTPFWASPGADTASKPSSPPRQPPHSPLWPC